MIRIETVDYSPFEKHLAQPRPCLICGGGDKEEWARVGVFRAVRCRACGLVWVDPFLTEAGFNLYYTDYIKFRLSDAKKMEQRGRMYEIDRAYLEQFVDRGDLLDVGCSAGFFLEKLSDRFTKNGLEKDPAAVALARERNPRLAERIQNRELGQDGFAPASFDVVTMRGVIEHLPDPRAAVKRVAELLRPGGRFYITATPDVSSYSADLYREKWNQFDPIQHIYYFSVDTLSRLCASVGLKLVFQAHPYLETPYASPAKDHETVLRDADLIRQGRRDEVARSPAFWGNMMTVLFQKA
ncbi:MAG: class I SAM-dependent methyltransferase [Elusimicrobiota bacterium]|nr:class I SAM-dependent methyltransferase [Elusimicrobiota bacterium]